MSAPAAIREQQAPLSDQAGLFFDILTHDDRNSRYIVAQRAGDSWHEAGFRASSLRRLNLSSTEADIYVTRNGFSGKRRKSERCRQINAMMFDIDCHSGSFPTTIPLLIRHLRDAVDGGVLPSPSLFVHTGRGVQIYYVLERSISYRVSGGTLNRDGVDFFRDVELGLTNRLRDLVADLPHVHVDTSVKDLSRVSRIPGSYNTKARRRCSLLSYSFDYYDLNSLKEYCLPFEETGRRRKPATVLKFSRLLFSRLRKIDKLQAHRKFDCVGSRENLCFVHYNTATQIYGPEEAYKLTTGFNARFNSPLPQSDIDNIKKTVDAVVIEHGQHAGEQGFYPLRAERVAELLFLTPEEIEQTGFFASKRADERQAAKAATRKKRAARDAKICALYGEGLVQREVAERVGCSVRTVATVTSREHIRRGSAREKRRLQFRLALDRKRESAKNAKNWHTSCCDGLEGPNIVLSGKSVSVSALYGAIKLVQRE